MSEEDPLPTKEQFLAGRRRRYAIHTPVERINDPFVEHMVRTRQQPCFLREAYDYDETEPVEEKDATAIWSFCRIGQSRTLLDDDTIVYVGGEHDDGCDPDFLIYNDVVLRRGDEFAIYSYPRYVFPPTDFHTATLLNSESVPEGLRNGILIVGCLGYSNGREFWRTPIYRLDPETLNITPVQSKGEEPGWIHGHQAALIEEHFLLVAGGKILNENNELVPNKRRFELDLRTMTWKASP